MGDIVHTVPMAVGAAPRQARGAHRLARGPAASGVLDLFPVADEVIAIDPPGRGGKRWRSCGASRDGVRCRDRRAGPAQVRGPRAAGRRPAHDRVRARGAARAGRRAFLLRDRRARSRRSRRAAEPAAAARAGHRRHADRDAGPRGASPRSPTTCSGRRGALRRASTPARDGRTSSGRPRSSAPSRRRSRSRTACRGWSCGGPARNRWRGASRRRRRGRRCWRRRPAWPT